MNADIFKDVLKHTYNTGHIELVKLTGTPDGIVVEAMEENTTMVLTGGIPHGIDKLEGVVGLSRMQILKGFLNLESFNEDGASITIATQPQGEYKVPAELRFSSATGNVTGAYRFMSSGIINEAVQIPPYKGAPGDVEIFPTTAAIKEFSSMNSILGSYVEQFIVKTTGNNLEFLIGTEASSQAKIVFATGITGRLTHSWAWPLSQVMSLIKLFDTSKEFHMSFSSQGALKITINSGIGTYQYILPAQQQVA